MFNLPGKVGLCLPVLWSLHGGKGCGCSLSAEGAAELSIYKTNGSYDFDKVIWLVGGSFLVVSDIPFFFSLLSPTS